MVWSEKGTQLFRALLGTEDVSCSIVPGCMPELYVSQQHAVQAMKRMGYLYVHSLRLLWKLPLPCHRTSAAIQQSIVICHSSLQGVQDHSRLPGRGAENREEGEFALFTA